jgi:hypothetical protein
MFDHQSCIIEHGEQDEAMHEGIVGITYREASVAIHVERKQGLIGSHAVALQVTMVSERRRRKRSQKRGTAWECD